MDTDIRITSACVTELADRLAEDPEALDDVDLDERVRLLGLVADAKDALQSVYKRVERGVLQLMDDRAHSTEDGYALERHAAKDNLVTDMPRLVSAVYKVAVESREVNDDGMIEDPGEVVLRTFVDTFGLHNKSATYRKGALKKLGLDPEEFEDFDGWKPPYVTWVNRPKRGDV